MTDRPLRPGAGAKGAAFRNQEEQVGLAVEGNNRKRKSLCDGICNFVKYIDF